MSSTILSISMAICGADDFTRNPLWGKANQEWLKELLVLRNGIPNDTFDRVFVNLDSELFHWLGQTLSGRGHTRPCFEVPTMWQTSKFGW